MADTVLSNVDFAYRRGSKENYLKSAIIDGSLNICKDTDELYADIDGRRIPLSGISIYDTAMEIFAIAEPEPVIYYAQDNNGLYHFNPVTLKWDCINSINGNSLFDKTLYTVSIDPVNPHIIHFYKVNGDSIDINLLDENTTYGTATADVAGIIKLYSSTGSNTDGTISQEALTTILDNKVDGNNGTAFKSIADQSGNIIDETYIKSINIEGTVVTVTKGNGSTYSYDTQDTTYQTADHETAGITKLYSSLGSNTDGTLTQAAIKATVDNLSNAIDSKLDKDSGIAYAAANDADGVDIKNRYIANVSSDSYEKVVDDNTETGTRLFFRRGNSASTFAIDIPDNNTKYTTGSSTYDGLTKLYSSTGLHVDGTMTQDAITNELSHVIHDEDTAYAAVRDNKEQVIDSTYLKGVTADGQNLIFVKGDGSTFARTITVDTEEVVNSIGTGTSSTLGIVKLYGSTGTNTNGAMTQKAITAQLSYKLDSNAMAIRAKQDEDGQEIDATYLKDIYCRESRENDTKTFTLVRGNGSTYSFTINDSNTKYQPATVDGEYGLVKLYDSTGIARDGALTQYAVSQLLFDRLRGIQISHPIYREDDSLEDNTDKIVSTLTVTNGDGSISELELYDYNTTYTTATSNTEGIGKLYGSTGTNIDGSITQDAISKALEELYNTLISRINNINSFNVVVLENENDLPEIGESHTIYFVPYGEDDSDRYNELIWIEEDNKYERIGSTIIDLTPYYTKIEVDQAIRTLQDDTVQNVQLSGTELLITKGNGSTYSFTTQDNNTTYSSLKNPYSISINGTTYDGSSAVNIDTPNTTYSKLSEFTNDVGYLVSTDKIDNASSADYATNAANGISNITRDGINYTVTRADGSTFTFDQQDNNTTYDSIKNPYILTINGTTYDGSEAVNINTPNTTYDIVGTKVNNASSADYASNAGTVNGHSVDIDVPSDALFTDTNTTYTSLKNPYSISINGSTYDGSEELVIDTPNTTYSKLSEFDNDTGYLVSTDKIDNASTADYATEAAAVAEDSLFDFGVEDESDVVIIIPDPEDPGTGDNTDPTTDPDSGNTDPDNPGTGEDNTDPTTDPSTGDDTDPTSDPDSDNTDPTTNPEDNPTDPNTGNTDPDESGTGDNTDPSTTNPEDDPTDPNDPGTGDDTDPTTDPDSGNTGDDNEAGLDVGAEEAEFTDE